MTMTDEAKSLREEAAGLDREAEESFERCDTDGFVSQWASRITAQQKRAQANIEDDGGVSEFPALFDLDGRRVPARLIDGRYGLCWALVEPGSVRYTGEFVSAFPKRDSTMTRKGYREGQELAPAKAVLKGSGRGLSSAVSVRVGRERTDDGTGQDERVRPVDDGKGAA